MVPAIAVCMTRQLSNQGTGLKTAQLCGLRSPVSTGF